MKNTVWQISPDKYNTWHISCFPPTNKLHEILNSKNKLQMHAKRETNHIKPQLFYLCIFLSWMRSPRRSITAFTCQSQYPQVSKIWYNVFICLLCASIEFMSVYYYLLGKGGYVFGNVGLSVYLSLSVCLWTILLKKLWTDWSEILWRVPGLYNEELIKFWWWSEYSKMSKWPKTTIIAVA